MKIQYEFQIVPLNGSHKSFVIKLPREMDPVADFLLSDIEWERDTERIIGSIDKVLNGNSEYEEEIGNACRIEIKPEKTRVVNYLYENLEEQDRVGVNWKYDIDTKDLKELVEIWWKELEAFKEQNK